MSINKQRNITPRKDELLNKLYRIWLNSLWKVILILEKVKLILTRSSNLFWLSQKDEMLKKVLFILTNLTYKFQCELWQPSLNILTNFKLKCIHKSHEFFVKVRFWIPDKIQLKFPSSMTKKHKLQYDTLESFLALPLFTFWHRIDFFHFNGKRGSGLKWHISPQNTQFSLKLKNSSSSALAHFWAAGFLYALEYLILTLVQ